MLFASGITRGAWESLRGERQNRPGSSEFIIFGALDRIGGALRSLFALMRRNTEAENIPYPDMGDADHQSEEPEYDLNADLELDDSLPKFLRRDRLSAVTDTSGRIEPFFANSKTPNLTSGDSDSENSSPNDEDPYPISRNSTDAPVRMKTHKAHCFRRNSRSGKISSGGLAACRDPDRRRTVVPA